MSPDHASRDSEPCRRIDSALSEVAVSRVVGVNPAHRVARNKLDGDGAGLGAALVPDDVHMRAARIDEALAHRIHMG